MREQSDAVDVVAGFWAALYDRDWDRIRSFFGPESIYYDVPTGPASAAKGPEGIEARLQLGLATLSRYSHEQGSVVGDGEIVFTEHAETWHWESGESVTLPFVSVQRVVDGRIAVWKDYWDYQTLMQAAPQTWHDRLDTADLWWLFDATGIA